ncbi:Rho termination factor [Flavobacterium sp. ANB]|uniref:DUF7218 family protein n=1 Tax=unclassified Flavobacterium TaxID=196869 RepID=UPI0012B8819F|nr:MULTISPECIES: Rho termination factor [unclassified Flavobacterium]MBF4515470.1 Rho termination factor [Flavobacterium sp. ANB]MTD68473.1 Rho termination factor [Flavobacterium sp. LC2016-13]
MPDERIKNEKQYQTLLEIGYSKENAARIANMPDVVEKGGNAKPYEEWTKDELYQQARKIGVEGRSYMNKNNLIKSLRSNT